jgi:hypothetical protein
MNGDEHNVVGGQTVANPLRPLDVKLRLSLGPTVG